jgi:putative glutamine amidotransferase
MGLCCPAAGRSCTRTGTRRTAPRCRGREYDQARDAVALELLRQVDEIRDLPLLASCRGMQELVVHRGGRLAEITGGSVPHRLLESAAVPDRWAPAHALGVRTGGFLATIAPRDRVMRVNSAHSDQVLDAGTGVFVEATAVDGVIEAVSVDWPDRLVLGIQWHFERRIGESAVDDEILAEFGRRCRARAAARDSGTGR